MSLRRRLKDLLLDRWEDDFRFRGWKNNLLRSYFMGAGFKQRHLATVFRYLRDMNNTGELRYTWKHGYYSFKDITVKDDELVLRALKRAGCYNDKCKSSHVVKK